MIKVTTDIVETGAGSVTTLRVWSGASVTATLTVSANQPANYHAYDPRGPSVYVLLAEKHMQSLTLVWDVLCWLNMEPWYSLGTMITVQDMLAGFVAWFEPRGH